MIKWGPRGMRRRLHLKCVESWTVLTLSNVNSGNPTAELSKRDPPPDKNAGHLILYKITTQCDNVKILKEAFTWFNLNFIFLLFKKYNSN